MQSQRHITVLVHKHKPRMRVLLISFKEAIQICFFRWLTVFAQRQRRTNTEQMHGSLFSESRQHVEAASQAPLEDER